MLAAYEEAIRLTFITVLAVWAVRMLYAACNQLFEHFSIPSMDETKKRTARKAFEMEYEELEKEESLNAFRRVHIAENSGCGIYNQLKSIYQFFIEGVKVIFALAFLIILIARASLGKGISIGRTILLTLVLLAFFAFSFWVNYRITDRIGKRMVELQQTNEKTNSLINYLFKLINTEKNAKDIALYGIQDYLYHKYEKTLSTSRAYTEYGIFEAKNKAKFSFVVQLLAGYIYVYVAVMALAGSISVGDVLMYEGAMITMMTSIQTLLALYNRIRYINKYLKTYEDFIKKPNMHYDGTLPVEKRDDNRYELAFHQVSFKYPKTDTYILKDVELTFKIGEKVALVGMNGAGKTTLIKLLLRFYEPTQGEITLNGIDIGKYDYEEYLRIFAVVFQDFGLFDFALDENIAGGEEIDAARMEDVIRRAGLAEVADRLPQRAHTMLYHENGGGISLSGGEAQKVAIARALYKDAPFVIMDEPTAALDPLAEAEVYENFDTLVGDKTAIYISHRMSSCRFSDRIIVLSEGRIAEEGTHASLMAKSGIYAQLFTTQAKYYHVKGKNVL